MKNQPADKRRGAPPEIAVIYEDNHLLVVRKPPNVLSQGDRTGEDDMLSLLKAGLKARHRRTGNVFLGLVHRLDRPVGGIMVFAKTSKCASRLCDQLRRRAVGKEYLAVTQGVPTPGAGRLEHDLARLGNANRMTVGGPDMPGAKHAVLDYTVLDRRAEVALVHVTPLTGRRHQIRVQLAAAGCPIAGDRKYGDATYCGTDPLALWALAIAFEHPTRRQHLRFQCLPPETWPWSMFDIRTVAPPAD